jgi:subfamily B ATP-binding cassette protein HlyB/CyaB
MSELDAIPLFGGGFMAVAQLASHHGVLASAAQLSHETGLGDVPPTADDLARSAIGIGLKARVVRDPTLKRLKSIPVPAIIKVKDGTWAVFGVETDPGLYRVIDPVTRRQLQLPIEDVLARIDRDLILIGKSAELSVEQLKFGLSWFVPALKRYRKPFVHVLVTSFFINLLALATPLVFQLVVDKVLVSKSYSTLVVVILAMVLISFFSGILKYLRAYVLNHTSNRIDVELGAKLYAHLVRLPISYFDRRPAGIIVTRAREIETVRRFLTDQSLTSVVDLLFLFIYIGVLFLYSAKLTLVIVLLIPVYFGISVLMKPAYRRRLKDKFRRWSKAQQLLVETVVGIQTIKASAVEPIFQKLWEERLSLYVKAGFGSTMLGTVTQTGIQFVTNLQTALVLFFGTQLVISGSLTVGGLIAFSMIGQRVTQPILRSAQLYQGFQEVQVSLEHLADILDAPIERQPSSLQSLAVPQGDIQLRNVSFRYRPELPEALSKVSLHVSPGEVVGIVGPSGSGKSTLTKLVQRFHGPTSGDILLDGIDIAQVDPTWLRRQLGVVLQENFLFNQTVHDNIALANPSMSRAQVVRVSRLAGADEFVSKLPQGYDTTIEERGANLSGGQRQRIAIARALATDPRILIFDEATSALDYESERIIRENMEQIARGRTVIIIAHRLAAVRHCDRIVGMVRGEITEVGTHDELIRRRNGLYARLWSLQTDQVSA